MLEITVKTLDGKNNKFTVDEDVIFSSIIENWSIFINFN